MDLTEYNAWEQRNEEYAREEADRHIKSFKEGYDVISFTTNQHKERQEYQMRKIAVILLFNGIMLHYKLNKTKKGLLKVSMRMFAMNPTYPEGTLRSQTSHAPA